MLSPKLFIAHIIFFIFLQVAKPINYFAALKFYQATPYYVMLFFVALYYLKLHITIFY